MSPWRSCAVRPAASSGWPRIAAAPAAPAAQPEGWRPTRLYIDGEWNSFRGELISMALVAEDGRHWYEELECRDPDPWVAANVIPKLEGRPVSLVGMRQSLHAWLAQFEAVHIVADWPEDIERFCWLLIRGPGERIDTPPLTMEVVRVDAPSANPHNALADARGLCAMLAAAPEREGGAS